MKKYSLSRTVAVLIVLGALLTSEPLPTQAAPPAPPGAPIPISPAGGSTIVIPTFTWQASAGAAKYDIEVGPQSDPNIVSWSAQTVHLTLTPVDAHEFPNAALYWRVRARDNSNVAGPWSPKINFTKILPAPAPVSPPVSSTSVITPTFEWERVPEATYYQVELSTSDTFIVMEATYTTYNTRLTPVDTIAHGLYYWRVRSVDAGGHLGTPSQSRSFTKFIPGPTLVLPNDGANLTRLTLVWTAVDGAAYYKVELSTSATFLPIYATYTTYNTQITPVDAPAPGAYYWRVSGVDAGEHVGAASDPPRRFTLSNQPAGTDPVPQLIGPAHGATLVADPVFEWTRVSTPGATYHLQVGTNPSFSGTSYDSVTTDYDSYTPYTGGDRPAYINDTYYWRVKAYSGGQWSEARSFTKNEPLPLGGPDDGVTGLVVDPTFAWSQIVGAHHYQLQVSTNPSFSGTPYDSVTTDYATYTPCTGGDQPAYVNGTYYWRVRASKSSGGVITTSEARSFTKDEPLPLITPANGAALASTPTFAWSQIVGAHHYQLQVSTNPSFSGTPYDSVSTDYATYTPYTGGGRPAYVSGTYYWRVQASKSSGGVITTSEARSFTIGIRTLYLPFVSR